MRKIIIHRSDPDEEVPYWVECPSLGIASMGESIDDAIRMIREAITPAVDLDAFVVMPNHVHGIFVLTGDPRYLHPTLGRVVNAYKGAVTAQIRQAQASDVVVWQARYHDHIIRDERGLQKIRDYVLHNPALWMQDTFYGE